MLLKPLSQNLKRSGEPDFQSPVPGPARVPAFLFLGNATPDSRARPRVSASQQPSALPEGADLTPAQFYASAFEAPENRGSVSLTGLQSWARRG